MDSIFHPFHKHPLILSINVDNESSDCYACGKGVSKRDWVYVCKVEKSCSSKSIFHRRCGEVATQIRHHSHPHLLHLFDFRMWPRGLSHRCNICGHKFGDELGYRCFSCDFKLDISCKKLELFGGEAREIRHASHAHPLILLRKPPFVFLCDACGEEDRDMAYMCATCNFLIHEACASLPFILPTAYFHHHVLTLSFYFLFEYRMYPYTCGVCDRDFDMSCWAYNCGDCRFFVHIRCAISSLLNQEKDEDGSILIQFPLEARDISKELITPFFLREVGLDKIPDVKDMPTSINMPENTVSYLFLSDYHKQHPLSLVSESESSSSRKDQVRTKINADDDEEEICNNAITSRMSEIWRLLDRVQKPQIHMLHKLREIYQD